MPVSYSKSELLGYRPVQHSLPQPTQPTTPSAKVFANGELMGLIAQANTGSRILPSSMITMRQARVIAATSVDKLFNSQAFQSSASMDKHKIVFEDPKLSRNDKLKHVFKEVWLDLMQFPDAPAFLGTIGLKGREGGLVDSSQLTKMQEFIQRNQHRLDIALIEFTKTLEIPSLQNLLWSSYFQATGDHQKADMIREWITSTPRSQLSSYSVSIPAGIVFSREIVQLIKKLFFPKGLIDEVTSFREIIINKLDSNKLPAELQDLEFERLTLIDWQGNDLSNMIVSMPQITNLSLSFSHALPQEVHGLSECLEEAAHHLRVVELCNVKLRSFPLQILKARNLSMLTIRGTAEFAGIPELLLDRLPRLKNFNLQIEDLQGRVHTYDDFKAKAYNRVAQSLKRLTRKLTSASIIIVGVTLAVDQLTRDYIDSLGM